MASPSSMHALVLVKTEGEFKPGPKVWHPIKIEELPVPTPKDDQVLVKVQAAGFNHRDVFQRQSLYPGTIFHTSEAPSILGADAVGVLVSPASHPLANKRVLVAPAVGWHSSSLGPDVPNQQFGILGSVKQTGGRGTFADYVAVGKDDVIECPEHLSREEAAAVPLGALTAWRATFTKANVREGDNVLITGIGGGVAILALQLAVAKGAKVWVTSSSPEKIKRAQELGAQGGVNYREEDWPKQLAQLLPSSRPYLDAVIDSAGGPLVAQLTRLLKDGAVVACYGQTSGKPIELTMPAVLKNVELKGSTMGSRDECWQAIRFIGEHQIKPVVDTALSGLDQAEEGFQLLKRGGQFGKVIITIPKDETSKL
ncbi:quinone oxidoreductase family protein [Rhodotorula paludigena]|uniref:quinone oxidoreductase family protein n=1 Tax=Rhodotorula paludigena TaxID=86838 RepID=UPI003180C711